LQAGTPIYYRGVQVGSVADVRLSADARLVDLPALIRRRYAPLVRANSRFWLVSGADVRGGLFSGVQVKLESIRSLISGGITFATPDDKMGPPATDGAEFPIFDEPAKEWLTWSPKIVLPPEDAEDEKAGNALPQVPSSVRSAVK